MYHVCIVPTCTTCMFADTQGGHTLLYYAAREGLPTGVERLLSSAGGDVDTAFQELFND